MILGNLNLGKTGMRLRKTDRFILDILATRLAQGGLSDIVAENKKRTTADGIYSKRRKDKEDLRINLMKIWAEDRGIDPNFAAALMYHVIAESCLVQDNVMVDDLQKKKAKINESNPEDVYALQCQNLLELTSAVADGYDQWYGSGLLGSMLYFKFEKKILSGMIAEDLKNHGLAIDLGCATGKMAFEVAHKFKRVIGYDISPDMIRVANSKKSPETSHIEFVVSDIEKGLDLPENSVSLAIMNMGTAGDIKNIGGVLQDIQKSLEPGGKFFLSFYNSESLFHKVGFIPWPVPLAAHMDTDRNCLEVHHDGEVYFIYAKQRNVQEVRNLLSDLEIDDILTFPTIASIIPNIITEIENGEKDPRSTPNKAAQKLIKDIDTTIAHSDLHCGTYIIVTGGKSAD